MEKRGQCIRSEKQIIMTTKTIKLIVFIAFLVHGIGHFQGVVAGLGVKFHGSSSTVSWLLKGLGENTNRIICLIIYLAAAIFGILTALSFKEIMVSYTNWQVFAIITAFISTFGLILFPNALAMFFNKIGAVAVNLLVFYSILFNGNWPAVIFEN